MIISAIAVLSKDYRMKQSSIYDCKIIDLGKIPNRKGNITVVENGITIPFDTTRIFYIYDIPGGEERGAHAHKSLYQLLIAASGSFDVVLKDGTSMKKITLNSPHKGLLIVPQTWSGLKNFSSGSICLTLASHLYDESDYIRNYKEFKAYKNV